MLTAMVPGRNRASLLLRKWDRKRTALSPSHDPLVARDGSRGEFAGIFLGEALAAWLHQQRSSAFPHFALLAGCMLRAAWRVVTRLKLAGERGREGLDLS